MNYQIRHVRQGDAQALAYIQTESWKAAFKDILDSETLARCTDVEKATAMYQRLLTEGIGNGYLLEVEGTPHCIAWWDKSREEDMPGYAELICIHSLSDRWRMGYGSKMMEKVLQDISASGYAEVMLWVFEENVRARKFYEKYGFTANGKSKPAMGAVEICYEKKL